MSRRPLRTTAAVLLGAALVGPTPAAPGAAAATSRDFFAVPAAALVRPLGEVPTAECAPLPAAQACQGKTTTPDDQQDLTAPMGNWPLSTPGLGIPLGGIGAGAFMINQHGTFGPWNMGSENGWEDRILPQAALHVREQVGSAPAFVRTLATDGETTTGTLGPVPQRSYGSPLSAWDVLKGGEGSYATLYPFGWMSYTPFKTDVSLRFFSPMVLGEDRRTSLPVAYFDVRLANHTGQTDRVSTMFTMPNAPAHDFTACHGQVSTTCPGTEVRTGLTSHHEAADGVQAVSLSSDAPGNSVDAAHSEWTIAALPSTGQTSSFATSWDANGTGADVYAPFRARGALPDSAIDASASAGAVSIAATLKPGHVTTARFALAWDFPQVTFSLREAPSGAANPGTYMRRYTDFYGAQETAANHYVPGSYPGHQGFAIAHDALLGHDAAVAAVQRWWKPIAEDSAYPLLLRLASLNQLYQTVMSSSFWDGGLVAPASVKGPDDARPGLHLFQSTDNGGGCCGEYSSWDVDSYGWLGYAKLLPNLDHDRLLAAADYETGLGPSTATPAGTQFLDKDLSKVFRFYAFAHVTHDLAFLREVYPAMKKEVAFVQGAIAPGSQLPSDTFPFPNTYDVVPQAGPGERNSSLYLLALEATIAAGQQLAVPAAEVAGYQNALEQAKPVFEALFWDPVQQWYRFSVAGTPTDQATALDTFYAQHIADVLGLPAFMDPAHVRLQQKATLTRFGRTDAAGHDLGGVNFAYVAGVEAPNRYLPPESSEIWPGVNDAAGADLCAAGRAAKDPQLVQDGLALATAVATQIWLAGSNGFVFDPPEAWVDNTTTVYRYPAYTRSFAVWGVLDAIKPLAVRAPLAAAPARRRPASTVHATAARGSLAATGPGCLGAVLGTSLTAAALVLRRSRRRDAGRA